MCTRQTIHGFWLLMVVLFCMNQSQAVAIRNSELSNLGTPLAELTSQVKCDGVTDDTQAINKVLLSTQKTTIYLPSGNCLYAGGGILKDGVTLQGAGRNATTLIMISPSHTGITVAGYGSGIRGIGFRAGVVQTSGSYVILSGVETFLDDFYMDGDYNGVLMTGNVARIRHGRFQDGAKGSIRIRAEGGDNSQMIDDVLMGAQTPQISFAGIRVRNSSALIIRDTSVIQQGIGLLIDPHTDNKSTATDTGSVYSLWVHDSFFDNSSGEGIKIAPTGNASVVRSRFSNNWTSSSEKDGFLIENKGVGTVSGIQILGNHSLLNQGNGIRLQGKMEDINIDNNLIAQNAIGIKADLISGLRITNSTIGKGGGINGNKQGLVIGSQVDKLLIQGNDVTNNSLPSVIDNGNNSIIKDNFGLMN